MVDAIEPCDVAVIGLGPAGSAAAIAAAASGAKVLAFDRKKVPGVPVQCAEFVPMMLGVDCGPVETALIQRIDAMESFVEFAQDRHNANFRGRMIDRAAFDREMVARAQAAGATIAFGCEVRDITRDGTVSFGDGRRIAPRVLIGADGPRSRVGVAIGCINVELVETRQATVQLLRRQASTDIYLSALIPGGYAWLFPKDDIANVGLGIDRAYRDRLKSALDSLLDMLVRDGKIDRRTIAFTGGAIPVGGPVGAAGRLGGVQVLLAGDAAGLANPVTGAGIPAACHSGKMAGEAAARLVAGEAGAVAEYQDECEDLFGASLRRAVDRRRELLARYTGGLPTEGQLRRGWIAYPDYWSNRPAGIGEMHDELLEA